MVLGIQYSVFGIRYSVLPSYRLLITDYWLTAHRSTKQRPNQVFDLGYLDHFNIGSFLRRELIEF